MGHVGNGFLSLYALYIRGTSVLYEPFATKSEKWYKKQVHINSYNIKFLSHLS